jgi:potassium-dependent mechanosensitive channel
LKKKQGYKKVFCKYANRITIVLYAILAGFAAAAQDKAATRDSLIPDSAIKPGFVDRIQKFGKEEAARSIITFKKDRDAIKQEELIEDIKKTTLKAKAYLKTSIDTFAINTELEKVKSGFNIAGDGVFTNTGTVQTYRNLTTTSKILVELLNKTTIRKNQIDRYEKDLVNFRFKIDSLNSDTILYDFPSDSIALLQYLQKIVVIAQAIAPTDSALKKAVTDIRGLQTRVDLLVNRLNSSLEEVDIFQKDLSDKNYFVLCPGQFWKNIGGFIVNCSANYFFKNIKANTYRGKIIAQRFCRAIGITVSFSICGNNCIKPFSIYVPQSTFYF